MRHKTENIIRPVYNLNEMAHDATIKLIRQVIDSKVNLEEVSWILFFYQSSDANSMYRSMSILLDHPVHTDQNFNHISLVLPSQLNLKPIPYIPLLVQHLFAQK